MSKGGALKLFIFLGAQALFFGIMIYVFAFSAKSTDAYMCGVEMARQHERVIEALGGPASAGTFAWTSYYESAGRRSEGSLSTTLVGPSGEGDLQIDFFRTPGTSSFMLVFEHQDVSHTLYQGAWPCK